MSAIEIFIAEREKGIMPEGNNSQNNESNISNSMPHRIKWEQIIPISLITVLIGAFAIYNSFTLEITREVTKLAEKVDSLQNSSIDKMEINSQFEALTEKVNDMSGMKDIAISNKNDIERLSGDIERLTNDFYEVFEYKIKASALPSVSFNYDDVLHLAYFNPPRLSVSEKIAINTLTNAEYSALELGGEPLLIPYRQEGKEILFSGALNDNNQWQGTCITNIYEKGKLILILEAQYDNGNIESYKQVFPYRTYRGVNVWAVSNRVRFEEYNSGETFNYFRDYDYVMDFEFNNAKAHNIIDVEEFKSNINAELEGYYYGNTSNGYYNDDTGNAYSVKFERGGAVRTLYKGMFLNGQYDDRTGTAWYITRDIDSSTDYMYFQGVFRSGNRASDDFHYPLTQDDIALYLAGVEINVPLIWEP